MQPCGDFDVINDIIVTFSDIIDTFRPKYREANKGIDRQQSVLNKKSCFQDEKNLYSLYQDHMRGKIKRDEWENRRNIFHLTFRFGDVNDLKTLLYFEEYVPDSILREEDDSNWTPLHYACRFRSNDEH